MKASLIFNDLSIMVATSTDQASSWFSQMFLIIAELIDKDICERCVNSKIDLYNISLIDDSYGFTEWLQETLYTDRDLHELALQISTQLPVFSCLDTEPKIKDEYLRSEFKLKDLDVVCEALGVALISDGIAVSLQSCNKWLHDSIEIDQLLYDDANGQFDFSNVIKIGHKVLHASQCNHVDIVIKNWKNILLEKVVNYQALIDKWSTLFPNLDKSREISLNHLNIETLPSTINRLKQLNKACEDWKVSNKDDPVYPMNVRPESKETMKQKDLAKKRLFTCPIQGLKYFQMHCDIQPKGYRLYWLENRNDKRITIGYIGSHLPTVRYKSQ